MEKLRVDSANSFPSSFVPKVENQIILGKTKFPFSIELDLGKAADMLCSAGVPREKIEEVSVIFVGKVGAAGDNPTSYYYSETKSIKINVDESLEEVEKPSKEEQYGQVEKMRCEENLRWLFMHESKHAGDDFKSKWSRPLYSAICLTVGIPMKLVLSPFPIKLQMNIWHHINPFEYGADKFAKRNKNNPQWDGLLKLS
jgi:hypothetical protein